MGVSIRLKRLGASQRPFFRVVAIDSRSATQGQALESIGMYHPLAKGQPLRIDTARVAALQKGGATLSPSVARLIKRAAEIQKA